MYGGRGRGGPVSYPRESHNMSAGRIPRESQQVVKCEPVGSCHRIMRSQLLTKFDIIVQIIT